MMKRWLILLSTVAFALITTGCAHPISLSPDISTLQTPGGAKIERKVGLAMSDDQRKLEITTAGGGGDKVNYLPYRDLETGLYYALSQSFSDVSRVSGLGDPKVKSEGLSYVITPGIATTSWSQSLVTWPPTLFTVELRCAVVDAQGKAIKEIRVQGEGRAEFDEFKTDHSLAAKRASTDALKKLIQAFSSEAAALR